MTTQKSIFSVLPLLFIEDSAYYSKKIDQVKSNICDSILICISILSIPALIVSFSIANTFSIKPIIFIHVFFVITLLIVFPLRKRLPYWFCTIILIFTLYIIGVSGMLQFDLLAPASLLFIVIPSLATTLFNTRTGLGVLLVSIFSFVVIVILDLKGFLLVGYNTNEHASRFFILTSYSIVYLMSGLILFIAVSISTRTPMNALSKTGYIAKELRQFIETANTPIFGIDNIGLIYERNQTAEQVTRYKKRRSIRISLDKIYSHE